MPDAYGIHEGRFVQELVAASAANATAVGIGVTVPEGKIWTILCAEYHPSVAETKYVHFNLVTRAINTYVITEPVSVALTAARGWPLLREGMELKLFPGESVQAVRDSATAGSSMVIAMRFLESDLPYYEYEEPQKKVVKVLRGHGSVYRSSGGISTGGTGGTSGPVERGGGGRGNPQPV